MGENLEERVRSLEHRAAVQKGAWIVVSAVGVLLGAAGVWGYVDVTRRLAAVVDTVDATQKKARDAETIIDNATKTSLNQIDSVTQAQKQALEKASSFSPVLTNGGAYFQIEYGFLTVDATWTVNTEDATLAYIRIEPSSISDVEAVFLSLEHGSGEVAASIWGDRLEAIPLQDENEPVPAPAFMVYIRSNDRDRLLGDLRSGAVVVNWLVVGN